LSAQNQNFDDTTNASLSIVSIAQANWPGQLSPGPATAHVPWPLSDQHGVAAVKLEVF
jgi:hypothetical protein